MFERTVESAFQMIWDFDCFFFTLGQVLQCLFKHEARCLPQQIHKATTNQAKLLISGEAKTVPNIKQFVQSLHKFLGLSSGASFPSRILQEEFLSRILFWVSTSVMLV